MKIPIPAADTKGGPCEGIIFKPKLVYNILQLPV